MITYVTACPTFLGKYIFFLSENKKRLWSLCITDVEFGHSIALEHSVLQFSQKVFPY